MDITEERKIEIPDNWKADFVKAMKIGYYKEFYRQGLISSDQFEKLMAMQDNKSVQSAA